MAKALTIEGLRKVYDNGFEALKGIDLKTPMRTIMTP